MDFTHDGCTVYTGSSNLSPIQTQLSVPFFLVLIMKWSCHSNQRVHCFAVLGQRIGSPSWLLTGSHPVDTQLLAEHIKGLWGWKKKSQIFRQLLCSNCRKCGQTDSSQLFNHHRELYSHTQLQETASHSQ